MTAQIIAFPRRTPFAGDRPPFCLRVVQERDRPDPARSAASANARPASWPEPQARRAEELRAVQLRRIGERVFVHHRDRISTGVVEFAMGAADGWTFYRVRIDGGPHRGICAAVDGDRVFGIGEPIPDARPPACAAGHEARRPVGLSGASAPVTPDSPDPSGSARPTGRPRPCAEPTERSEGGREE